MVRIMSDNKYKANVDSLFCNWTYSFIYNVRTTELGQFLNLRIFYINNFQVCTSIAVDVQLQS